MPDSMILSVLDTAQHEVMLFAAAGLVLGGIDDLAIDIIYLVRQIWKRLFIYTRHERMNAGTLPLSLSSDPLAIFVPAWQESAVIGHMLRAASGKWQKENYRIFVGVYPNDPATLQAVLQISRENPKIVATVHDRNGPTTKADCLNSVWRAMVEHEGITATRFKGIVMHDAEDVVHADELRLLSVMIDRFDLVQLPVLPLVSQQSRWVAGHYCDEFADPRCLLA